LSVTNPKFKALLRAIERSLIQGAAQASRDRKEARIQEVAINATEILSEITSIFSPFKVPGREVSDSDLGPISKTIANDLWSLFKTHTKGKHFVVGQERDFLNHVGIAFLFDDARRVIFAKSSKSTDNQEIFRANAMKPVQDVVKGRGLGDPTNLFINKHPEYQQRWNNLNKLLTDEFDKSPEGKALQGKEHRRAYIKKLENIRSPKRGAAFGSYPTFFWSKKFTDLKAEFGSVNLGGTQLGHAFGGQVSIATNLVENRDDFLLAETAEEIKLISTIPASFDTSALKAGIFKVAQSDANVEFKRTSVRNEILGEITILLPELKDKNQKEGSDAQKAFNTLVVPELLKIKELIVDAKGSLSINDLITERIELEFLGKKSKNRTFITRAKIKRREVRVPTNRMRIKGAQMKVKKTTGRLRENKDGSLNLQSLMAFLNTKLHDKIKENMGKGTSTTILNYRTGRFARSARIKALLPSKEKGSINARVKYMRNPYGVFEPGNTKLSKPGRSPARIFGRSIRQLLQEEKIATLRRVKVELIG